MQRNGSGRGPINCLHEMRMTTKALDRAVHVPAEFRTEFLMNNDHNLQENGTLLVSLSPEITKLGGYCIRLTINVVTCFRR